MYSIIPCQEKHGSVQENFSILDAPEASVTLQCAYGDRYTLVSDLLLNRRPWPYYSAPYSPLATTCQIRNIETNYITDASQQQIYYDTSEVTVHYTSKFQDLYAEELEPTAEYQQIDNNLFRWQNGTPLSENTEIGFLRRGFTLVKTFYDVLDPLPSQLMDYVGCVNSDLFINSMGFIFTPETLLYCPPHLSRTVRFDSTNAWQLTLRFVYKKPIPSNDPFPGWNTFWNPNTQLHERIVCKIQKFGSLVSTLGPYYQYPLVPFSPVFFGSI